MIFFSIGLPSRFADWCDTVLARLVQHNLGTAEVVAVENLEQVALSVIRTTCPHLVAVSRQPQGSLRQALFDVNARSLIAMNHPRDAVRHLVEHGSSIADATRVAARSCASMVSWTNHPTTLVLYVDTVAADPVGAVHAIAEHFQLPAPTEIVSAIVAEIGAGFIGVGDHEAWFNSLGQSDRAVIDGALGGYVSYFAGGQIGQIIWERDLFYIFEQPFTPPHPPANRPMDISGTARRIIFGPYITLPPGSWSVAVGLAVSKEAAEIGYSVQVVTDVLLSQVAVQPRPDQIVHANLQFSVPESGDPLFEICVQMDRASIGGKLALVNATLTPVPTTHGDARAYLEAAEH